MVTRSTVILSAVLIIATAIVLPMLCKSKSNAEPPTTQKIDTVYTTIDLVADIGKSEYARVTAMKIVFDTVKVTGVDSAGSKIVQEVKRVRDSSYMAWYPVPIVDSTGNVVRNKANTADSAGFKFIPVEKKWILHDFNKQWPVKK